MEVHACPRGENVPRTETPAENSAQKGFDKTKERLRMAQRHGKKRNGGKNVSRPVQPKVHRGRGGKWLCEDKGGSPGGVFWKNFSGLVQKSRRRATRPSERRTGERQSVGSFETQEDGGIKVGARKVTM